MIYKSIYLARRNPSIAPEDWPRAWRSHPKAVAQMDSVGAAMSAVIDSINYCARVRDAILPGLSLDHDGVAIVSSASEGLHQIGRDRTGQEAVIADEVRVFGCPADEFAMACREVIALGGAPGKVAVIRFLIRKTGSSQGDFKAHWAGQHADLARTAVADGKIVRHVLNEIVRAPMGYAFDGISESWFSSIEDATRSLVDPLSKDLPAFCDPAKCVTMLTEVIYRVPRE